MSETNPPVAAAPAATDGAPVAAAPAAETPAPTPVVSGMIWGTGRRKTSVARVRLLPGDGKIEINDLPFDTFFKTIRERTDVMAALKATKMFGKVNIFARTEGGGPVGQAGAVSLGIARALKVVDPALEPILRDGGFLTRDDRKKERKKYGQRGARRRFQFSKR
jgi:small subunit ribosomal protein S9